MVSGTPGKGVRVLVVEESDAARKGIVTLLARDAGIVVVGDTASDADALAMAGDLRADLVTVGIGSAGRTRLELIDRIMTTRPVPMLVFASRDDAATGFAALAKGALEVMEVPGAAPPADDLIRTVRLLAGVKAINLIRRDRNIGASPVRQAPEPAAGPLKGAVAVAAATGGPRALATILSGLPSDFPAPVLVAQHLAEGFCRGLVEWLNTCSRLKVVPGIQGDAIMPGRVYVAPSERNMLVGYDGRIILRERGPGDGCRSSCDALLGSAADVFRASCVGIVLTGMGTDGAAGMAKIRASGGVTVAQDERSSVIFDMPRQAIDRGAVKQVLPLDKIAAELVMRLWHTVPPRNSSTLRDERPGVR